MSKLLRRNVAVSRDTKSIYDLLIKLISHDVIHQKFPTFKAKTASSDPIWTKYSLLESSQCRASDSPGLKSLGPLHHVPQVFKGLSVMLRSETIDVAFSSITQHPVIEFRRILVG